MTGSGNRREQVTSDQVSQQVEQIIFDQSEANAALIEHHRKIDHIFGSITWDIGNRCLTLEVPTRYGQECAHAAAMTILDRVDVGTDYDGFPVGLIKQIGSGIYRLTW